MALLSTSQPTLNPVLYLGHRGGQSSPTNQLLSITYVVDLADRAFAIIAIAIATVPVLYHSLKEDRLLRAEHQAVQARMYSPEFTKGREREPMAA